MLAFKMVNQLALSELFFAVLAQVASEEQRVEHMLVGYMDVFLYCPRLCLAVGASVVSIGDDLEVGVAEDPFAFFTLARIVQRDAIAYWTGDEFWLQKALASDPFFINSNQFWLFQVGNIRYRILFLPFLHRLLVIAVKVLN